MIRYTMILFCIIIFIFIPICSLDANSPKIVGVNAYVDYSNNVKLNWSVIVENDVSSVDVTIKYGESENIDININYTTNPFNRYSGQNYTIPNTELKPETTYYYQIIVDAGGNGLLKSEIFSFVTKAECNINFTNSLEGKEFMVGDTVSIDWDETNANSITFSVLDSIGFVSINMVKIENSGNYKWIIPDDFLDMTTNRFYNIKLDVFCTDSRSSAQTKNFRIGTIKDLKLPDKNIPTLNEDVHFSFPDKGSTLKLNQNYYIKWTMPEEKKKGIITLWLEGKKLPNNNYRTYPIGGTAPGTDLPPVVNNRIFDWYVQDKYEHNNVMKLEYYEYERDPSNLNLMLITHEAQKLETAEKITYNFPPQIIEPGQYRIFGNIYYGNSTPNSLFYSDYFNISKSDEDPSTLVTLNDEKKVTTSNPNIKNNIAIQNKVMHTRLKGKIILKVEDAGEAYYVHPQTKKMYYLGRPKDAFSVMREQGVGITNNDLNKIPIGLDNLSGPDSDGDGLSDLLEDAIGTDKNKIDTDGDGFNDKDELNSGYSPVQKNAKLNFNTIFSEKQKGRILLQVEGHGEAWYINPSDGKRYFLGRPSDAFSVMRSLGLGISNSDFDNMQ